MSDQRLLFEPPEAAQMAKIWHQLGHAKQQRIIAILAEMGQAALTKDLTARKETSDEL